MAYDNEKVVDMIRKGFDYDRHHFTGDPELAKICELFEFGGTAISQDSEVAYFAKDLLSNSSVSDFEQYVLGSYKVKLKSGQTSESILEKINEFEKAKAAKAAEEKAAGERAKAEQAKNAEEEKARPVSDPFKANPFFAASGGHSAGLPSPSHTSSGSSRSPSSGTFRATSSSPPPAPPLSPKPEHKAAPAADPNPAPASSGPAAAASSAASSVPPAAPPLSSVPPPPLATPALTAEKVADTFFKQIKEFKLDATILNNFKAELVKSLNSTKDPTSLATLVTAIGNSNITTEKNPQVIIEFFHQKGGISKTEPLLKFAEELAKKSLEHATRKFTAYLEADFNTLGLAKAADFTSGTLHGQIQKLLRDDKAYNQDDGKKLATEIVRMIKVYDPKAPYKEGSSLPGFGKELVEAINQQGAAYVAAQAKTKVNAKVEAVKANAELQATALRNQITQMELAATDLKTKAGAELKKHHTPTLSPAEQTSLEEIIKEADKVLAECKNAANDLTTKETAIKALDPKLKDVAAAEAEVNKIDLSATAAKISNLESNILAEQSKLSEAVGAPQPDHHWLDDVNNRSEPKSASFVDKLSVKHAKALLKDVYTSYEQLYNLKLRAEATESVHAELKSAEDKARALAQELETKSNTISDAILKKSLHDMSGRFTRLADDMNKVHTEPFQKFKKQTYFSAQAPLQGKLEDEKSWVSGFTGSLMMPSSTPPMATVSTNPSTVAYPKVMDIKSTDKNSYSLYHPGTGAGFDGKGSVYSEHFLSTGDYKFNLYELPKDISDRGLLLKFLTAEFKRAPLSNSPLKPSDISDLESKIYADLGPTVSAKECSQFLKSYLNEKLESTANPNDKKDFEKIIKKIGFEATGENYLEGLKAARTKKVILFNKNTPNLTTFSRTKYTVIPSEEIQAIAREYVNAWNESSKKTGKDELVFDDTRCSDELRLAIKLQLVAYENELNCKVFFTKRPPITLTSDQMALARNPDVTFRYANDKNDSKDHHFYGLSSVYQAKNTLAHAEEVTKNVKDYDDQPTKSYPAVTKLHR